MNTDFKYLRFFHDTVRIEHHYSQQYRDHDFADEYTLQHYRDEILRNYERAQALGWTKIIDVNDTIITTEMPKYSTCTDDSGNLSLEWDLKEYMGLLKGLCKQMKHLGIMHSDFALRNVTYDPMCNMLKLIDLNDLIAESEFYKRNIDTYTAYWTGTIPPEVLEELNSFLTELYNT